MARSVIICAVAEAECCGSPLTSPSTHHTPGLPVSGHLLSVLKSGTLTTWALFVSVLVFHPNLAHGLSCLTTDLSSSVHSFS